MKEEVRLIDKYWKASNYIAACQLYLKNNPLLKKGLKQSDIKNKVIGHWGTVPGQNFIYTHLNRVINKYNLDMIYITGPGHGGNFFVSQSFLEGTYSENYPEITKDEVGLQKLCKSFSFPGGIGSHATPEVPGSISEGGELGYSLAHAYGAVLDNPNLIAACIIGDGEAETGPLSTSWNGNKFVNPLKDGFVLPIIHLNGYKINNPTVLSRMSNDSLTMYFQGLGYKPLIVSGDTDEEMHERMMESLDTVCEAYTAIRNALEKNPNTKFYFPMLIVRSKKGWSGPKKIKDQVIEGTFRAHQVPITIEDEKDIKELEKWLKSYNPDEIFNEDGTLVEELENYHPKGDKRMSANPITNSGNIRKELILPDPEKFALKYEKHGSVKEQDMLILSDYIREVFELNKDNKNYRFFCPDEASSNRLYHIYEATKRNWQMDISEYDENLSKDGRLLDSYLSEHLCEGMLEGYLLTGRHGSFASYESFIRVVDSMVSQHAKWIKMSKEVPWRKPVSSLNLICTSHVWQQDHNGYTHQDPGFLNHVADKKNGIVDIYLPIDANTLLLTYDKCLKTVDKVNTVVASKHPSYQWLTYEEAKHHIDNGISIFKFASTKEDDCDVIIATCGDTPNQEGLAAVSLLKEKLPEVRVRYINVLEPLKLSKNSYNGLTDYEYDMLFTKNKPIIFTFHGYPSLIKQLTYERNNRNIEIFGYEEEGSITTSFDMRVRNKIDRYHIILKVIEKLALSNNKALNVYNEMNDLLKEHHRYIREEGIDTKEILDYQWEE